MARRHALAAFGATAVALLVVSCSDPGALYDEDVVATSLGLPKGAGGSPGDVDYCRGSVTPCVAGDGDCDANDECDTGLVCMPNQGARFGFAAAFDVCLPLACRNRVWDAEETGVDCGGTSGCGPCASQANAKGTPFAALADARFCVNPNAPCDVGEGDCDGNAECAPGLVCAQNAGRRFGLSTSVDVCVPPSCANRVRDAGEELIDCGGTSLCGACTSFYVESPSSTARVLVTDSADLYPREFTYEAWVYFDSLADTDPAQTFLIGEDAVAPYSFFFARLYRDHLECAAGTGGGGPDEVRTKWPVSKLSARTWYHVACTHNEGGALGLWLDGVLVASEELPIYSPAGAGSSFAIGGDFRSPPQFQVFVGRVDEVRVSRAPIYTESFSPARRLAVLPSTVALWHFDEGSGVARDSARPTRAPGVLSGGALWRIEP